MGSYNPRVFPADPVSLNKFLQGEFRNIAQAINSIVGATGANPTATAGPTAINGVATTYMRSDAAPAIQLGSAAQKGIVQVDGTTLLASGGIISAALGSNSQKGVLQVDGTTIQAVSSVISLTGTLPATSSAATQFTCPLIIGGSAASSSLTLESTSGAGTTDAIFFKTASQVERLRIDSAGDIITGGVSAQASFTGVPTPQFQHNYTGDYARLGMYSWLAGASHGTVIFHHSRNNTIGTQSLLQTGDGYGSLEFCGSDGVKFVEAGAIIFTVDGTPALNSMPAKMIIETTPSGGTAAIERFRIDSAGNVTVTNGTLGFLGGNGTGGTVTQLTSISTAVTLNKICGQITTVSNAFTAGTFVNFQVNNSLVSFTDVVVVNIQGVNNALVWVNNVANGSFGITIDPLATGTTSLVINFAVFKSVAS